MGSAWMRIGLAVPSIPANGELAKARRERIGSPGRRERSGTLPLSVGPGIDTWPLCCGKTRYWRVTT